MKNLTWQNPEQLFVAQVLINKVKSKCCGIKVSIDYAVMEKAERIYVLPAEFGWSDLGSWGSLHSLLPKDNRNNAIVGENIRLYECNNCIVHTPHLKQAVIQGLDGYIIAEKEGTLLICKLAEEQRIKEFSKA